MPVRGFRGSKSRLADVLTETQRANLSSALATRTVRTATASGHRTAVVTGDPEVRSWAAAEGVEIIDDAPGGGLDGAAERVIGWAIERQLPWLLLHADLPLLTSHDLAMATEARAANGFVVAPSYNGGTPLLGGIGPFTTSYGEGSFHRHLALLGCRDRAVVTSTGLALDVDSGDDLDTIAALPCGDWLAQIL